MKRLYKIKDDGKVSGVCAGIADYTKIDVTLVRILTFFLCCASEVCFIIYVLLAFLLPNKDKETSDIESSENEI